MIATSEKYEGNALSEHDLRLRLQAAMQEVSRLEARVRELEHLIRLAEEIARLQEENEEHKLH